MDEIVITYSELAERLGIKLDSARKLARRKKWPKTVGNDGLAKVRVPVDELPTRNTKSDDPAPANDDVPTDMLTEDPVHIRETVELLTDRVGLLERLVDTLNGRVTAAENDRDAWRSMAQKSWWERIFGKR